MINGFGMFILLFTIALVCAGLLCSLVWIFKMIWKKLGGKDVS